MKLINSTIKIASAKLISSIAGFTAVIIFSKSLGATSLGTYYPFLALLGIVAIPADLGIRSATEKRLSEGTASGSYLGSALALKLPPLIVAIGGIVLARDYINQYLGADLAYLLALTLLVHEAGQLSLSVIRGELRVGETAVVQILRPLGWLTVGYGLFIQGYGVHSLVYGYLAGTTAMAVFGWWKISTSISRPTINHIRSLYEYGRFSVISSVGGYFYSWMDVAILSLFVSTGIASTRGEIGAYENAWRVSLVVIMVSQAIATTIFPQISRWDAEDASEQIEKIIPKAILPALLIVLPAFFGTMVLAKDILRVLFTTEFTVAWLVLIIFMGEKVLQAIHVVLGRSLQAIDRPDLAAYATLVAVMANLVLNICLIWWFGIIGAAVATTVSFAINTVIHAYYLNEFIAIEFPTREAIWSLIASMVMGLVVFWVRSIFVVQNIVQLLGIITIGAICYLMIVLAHPQIRDHTREALAPLISRHIV